jgi:hypothetical protein
MVVAMTPPSYCETTGFPSWGITLLIVHQKSLFVSIIETN